MKNKKFNCHTAANVVKYDENFKCKLEHLFTDYNNIYFKRVLGTMTSQTSVSRVTDILHSCHVRKTLSTLSACASVSCRTLSAHNMLVVSVGFHFTRDSICTVKTLSIAVRQ